MGGEDGGRAVNPALNKVRAPRPSGRAPPLILPPPRRLNVQVGVDLARFKWGDFNGDSISDLLLVANGGS